jgi:SAM-dependent methyltransferase
VDDHARVNLDHWNELVDVHARSAYYDLDRFRAGGCSLRPLELDEVGDVRGLRLLHLQCHFGQDTLSWARLGAEVTGVDFSDRAIGLARSLSEELGVPARFLCADLYQLPEVLDETFDVVFTSYGVLCWLRDLDEWARVVASLVAPGGRFHLFELHPFASTLDDGSEELAVRYPYFRHQAPLRYDQQGSYADRQAVLDNTVTYSWTAPLGAVVTALASAGLRVESLREVPYALEQLIPRLWRSEDGWWRLPYGEGDLVPLSYALRATRP